MDFFLPGARRPLLIPRQHWDTGINPSSSLAGFGGLGSRANRSRMSNERKVHEEASIGGKLSFLVTLSTMDAREEEEGSQQRRQS